MATCLTVGLVLSAYEGKNVCSYNTQVCNRTSIRCEIVFETVALWALAVCTVHCVLLFLDALTIHLIILSLIDNCHKSMCVSVNFTSLLLAYWKAL